jgi:predicted nucleotidyltransferase
MLRKHRKEILRVAAASGARNLRVFGSVARGDAKPGSDVDLLVEFEAGRSLWDLVGLQQDLEELLGVHVEVATGVHELIAEKVGREAIAV